MAIAQLSLEVEGAGIPYQLKFGRPGVGRELGEGKAAQFRGAHAEGRLSLMTASVLIILESELDALARRLVIDAPRTLVRTLRDCRR